MSTRTGIQLKLERTFDASLEHVYDVLTKADHIGNWFGPSDDFKITVHEWNASVGGRYRVEFNTPSGETHIVVGEFKELVINTKIAYSWSWEGKPPMDSLVTFEITKVGEKTALSFTHEGFPSDDSRDHHTQGWTGSLERFTRALSLSGPVRAAQAWCISTSRRAVHGQSVTKSG
jgi:uncharacterized protein YndB with AHSA1/START domain